MKDIRGYSILPNDILHRVEESEKEKRFSRTNKGMCNQCNSICSPSYYIGTFTSHCSYCIEKNFVEKFKELLREYDQYKQRKA